MLVQMRRIADVIARVAKEEGDWLSRYQKGIFFVPELAFAYICGKALMTDAARIFDGVNVEWMREINIGTGGPADLVFVLESGHRIVIEFKIASTWNSYVADIDKLARLKSERDGRMFCVLLDSFSADLADKRIKQTELRTDQKLIRLFEQFPNFTSLHPKYKRDVSCQVVAWAVGQPPSLQQL